MGNVIFNKQLQSAVQDGVLRRSELSDLQKIAAKTPDKSDDQMVKAMNGAFKDGAKLQDLKLGSASAIKLPQLSCLDDIDIFYATGEPVVFDRSKTVESCLTTLANYPSPKFSQPPLAAGALYDLTANSGSPNISGGGNVYEQMVNTKQNGKSVVDRLRENILKSSKQPLAPQDVLKQALDASNGDYTKAVLATHNLLKSIAYNGREKIGSLSSDDLNLVKKLGSLRPHGSASESDKMGPWYHFFGVLTMGALTGKEATHAGLSAEHLSREAGSQKIRKLTANMLSYLQGQDPMSLAISPKDNNKAKVDEAAFDIVRSVSGEQRSVLANTLAGAVDNLTEAGTWGATKIVQLSHGTLQASYAAGERLSDELDEMGVLEPIGNVIVQAEPVVKDIFVTARDFWKTQIFGK